MPLTNTAWIAVVAAGLSPSLLTGQSPDHVSLHGGVVLLATVAAPGFAGRRLVEGYVTQPNLMVHASRWSGRVEFSGTVNLEAITLRRGELNAGIWGEGYIDRRHPHTVAHEAMISLSPGSRSPLRPALSLGKGFVPFGTDDPMSRPFVKFPINHHLSQLLERGQVVVAVGGRRGAMEAAIFNGDEPEKAISFANLARVGDSWAARATAWPMAGLELSASFAAVASPEVPDGSGLDQRKWNIATRFSRTASSGRTTYVLAEYSRTRDFDNELPGLSAGSMLVEAAYGPVASLLLSARLEQTDRLEEERLADPFRSPRPHYDAHQLGSTRWQAATMNISIVRRANIRPFAEVAYLRASPRPGPSFFEPALFYGAERMWSVSAGARLGFGRERQMGRYGPAVRRVASNQTSPSHRHE